MVKCAGPWGFRGMAVSCQGVMRTHKLVIVDLIYSEYVVCSEIFVLSHWANGIHINFVFPVDRISLDTYTLLHSTPIIIINGKVR